MRQAVIIAADQFAVRSVPPPTLANDHELVVRTVACGICSGDLMPWYLAKKVGTVLGHEVVGRAMEVGSAVEHIRPGDLVFVHHHAPCLDCPECARGATVHCSTWKRSALDPGGMAEYFRAPSEIVQHDAFAVNDLHAEDALFIEPLGCCVKAFHRLGASPVASAPGVGLRAKRIVVVGCGVMGLLNIQTAFALGAEEVVAVELDARRRDFAREVGATQTLTPEQAEKELARWADIVVIGPGFPEVIRQALGYVRNAGFASLFTPTPTAVLTELDLGELYFREVSLVPSYSCGPTDTRVAYELLRAGLVRPRSLITHRFALEEIQSAYDTARRGGAAMKVIVTFPEVP